MKPSSIEITNALNTLQNLCAFYKVGIDMLGFLQRFEYCMCMTQLENNLAFWIILTENKTPVTVKYRYIFSLLLPLSLTKVNIEVNTVLGVPNPLLKARILNFLLSRTFAIPNFLAGLVGVQNSECPL